MSELRMNFEWWRDPKGYRLTPVPHEEADETIVHPLGIRVGVSPENRYRIVRGGGDLQPYRPFETYGPLYKVFAKIGKPTEVVDFVQKFGPLTERGLNPRIGDDVDVVLVHADAMREALCFAAGGTKTSALLADAQVAPFATMDVSLVLDPATRRPQVKISPPCFLDALWLSLAQDISQQGNLRVCGHCRDPFRTGPGTGRRLDAKFCSEQHKIAFHSLKRSNGGKHVRPHTQAR